MTDPNVIPLKLSKPTAARIIKEIALDTDRIVPVPHAKKRMKQRRMSITQVRRVVQAGFIDGDPWMDQYGNWRVDMRGMSAGEQITVGLAIEWKTKLLIITVFQRKEARMYHYTECGLPNVWLSNGFTPHATPYGETMIIEHVEGLHRAIGLDLVHRKPNLSGSEFRFLRKELDLSQNALADYFGNDAQSVALWEKRGRVPKWADRFLRAIYREHVEGNAHIKEIVARLNDLDRQEFERQVFKDTPDGWKSAA